MPTPANLFAIIVFSLTGFAMFTYGRKQGAWRSAAIGAVLMIYPYFIERTWLLYTIGIALCAALFVWRE